MARFEILDDQPKGRFEILDDPGQDKGIGSEILQGAGNILAGAVRGAGSIGATLLAPIDIAKDAIAGKGLSLESNRQRRAAMDAGLQEMGAEPDSLLYKGGKLGGEVAGTLGAGGLVANGVRAVAPAAIANAPRFGQIMQAIESGGFTTGAPAASTFAGKAADLGIRAAGGAITGGASSAMVDPESAGTGALIGGVLPPVVAGLGGAGRYIQNAAGSLVKPFTQKGQDEIAQNILRQFSEGGPTALNTKQLVPGSIPTLAESTGNAGLATAQRVARDLRPNAFVERESQNAAARNALFGDIAGDAGKLDFYRASRDQAASELYGKALDAANQQPLTPYIKGQVTQLLKRPSVDSASRTAQRWAIERGEAPDPNGSLSGLHDVKTAIDDMISESTRQGKGGEVKALQSTKAKLLNVMEKLSPDYAEARNTYAAMSSPINAMEALQGLNLSDAKGNITLAKVQNALRNIESARNAPGIQPAKSITDDQLRSLTAIRDDLLRKENTNLGKSAGSNTFQNLATDNIMSSFLGTGLSKLANKTGIGGLLGQAGRLAYSGPDEAIRNRLVDMMLEPTLAAPAFAPTPLLTPTSATGLLGDPRLLRLPYLAAPVGAATSR